MTEKEFIKEKQAILKSARLKNAGCLGTGSSAQCDECAFEHGICSKLGEYEDMEEQGKLIKLPCAVGDTVYVKMQSGGYAEAEVRDFSYFLTCGFCAVVTSKYFNKRHIPFSEFGKTIFTAKSEAGAKGE